MQIICTIAPQLHLGFERFELFRRIRLDLSSHTLFAPLLEATELLVDVHPGCCSSHSPLGPFCQNRVVPAELVRKMLMLMLILL